MNEVYDPTSSHVISVLLNGIKKESPKSREMLQISIDMLHELLHNIGHIITCKYDRIMYKAILLLQYHTCARIGELVTSGKNTENVLRLDQLIFTHGSVKNSPTMVVDFLYYKHSQDSSESITIPSFHSIFCPVSSVKSYLLMRGRKPGLLFMNSAFKPVTRTEVSKVLDMLLIAAGYENTRYDTHGLRRGRASQAAADGWSDCQIQRLGRWKSMAFKKYLKGTVFASKSYRYERT